MTDHKQVGWLVARTERDFLSKFVVVHDARTATYLYRRRHHDGVSLEFNGREVVIKWKGCGGTHNGLACNSPNKTACVDGTITLRPFKSLEEATVASFPVFKRLWDRDGDHAIFARVMECFGIDSTL